MRGVQAGHLGAKMGRHGLDNGWVRFNHVRVPLDHMLCRWGKVEPNGEYSAAPTAQLAYATLIGERIWIVRTPEPSLVDISRHRSGSDSSK
jgi:acyl-CoA oxidase